MDTVVQDPANSIHFLWAAYLVVAAANIAFVIWLAKTWSATRPGSKSKP